MVYSSPVSVLASSACLGRICSCVCFPELWRSHLCADGVPCLRTEWCQQQSSELLASAEADYFNSLFLTMGVVLFVTSESWFHSDYCSPAVYHIICRHHCSTDTDMRHYSADQYTAEELCDQNCISVDHQRDKNAD